MLKFSLPALFVALVAVHIAPHLSLSYLTPPSISLLSLAFLFWPLNLLFETWKWKNLTYYFPQKTSTLAKEIMVGQYLGLFTPNRIGEAAGRVLYTPSEFRKNQVFAFANGAMAQLLTTLCIGSIALTYTYQSKLTFDFPGWSYLANAHWFVLATSLFLLMLYLFPSWSSALRKKWNPNAFPGKYLAPLQVYSTKNNTYTLALSILRYAVFATQYLILLHAFGVTLPTFDALTRIALVYLCSTLIPTGALADLGVRESAAALFLAPSPELVVPVITVTLVLWIINIAIPASIGLLLTFLDNQLK